MKKRVYGAALALLMCVISLTAFGEGLLPALSDVYGVAMPSLGDVLKRYADSEEKEANGSTVQHWNGITEDDFESFSAYLAECQVELRNYTVENGVFSAMIGKNGREFRFEYNPKAETASIVYPKGTFDERSYLASCRYELAKRLMNEQKYEDAVTLFEELKEYSDSAIQIAKCKESMNERDYLAATALLIDGQIIEAYKAFYALKGYKDVDTLLDTNANLLAAARHEANQKPYKTVGGYTTFGKYPQTSSCTDHTAIEWLVLDYDETNNRSLLISRYIIDMKPYHSEKIDITWEECTLRKWLNSDFLNEAFTAQEQSAILLTDVDNSRDQGYRDWNTIGGNNTQDKVFLLSYTEAHKYLGVKKDYTNNDNIVSMAAPTAFVIKRYNKPGSEYYQTASGEHPIYWLLRSPGYYQHRAAIVSYGGDLDDFVVVNDEMGPIRPAFWLDLNSEIFW